MDRGIISVVIKNWDQYKDLEYYPDRFCKCGCGGRIKVQSHHKCVGVPKYIHGHNKGMLGKHHLEESKQKIREFNQGRILPEETKKKIGKGNAGKTISEEHKRIIRESKLGDKNPMKRPEVIRKHIKACGTKPNKSERKLKKIFNRLFLREYQINVDADVMILGSKVPDFVNINGQKKIIELFGDYWHSKKITGRTKIEEENQRINHFAKYGYQTLIVWEHELKSEEVLESKLLIFNQAGN